MSKLSPEQAAYVHQLAASAATLSTIQNGLREEHDVHLTYMEARLLMMDLKITLDEDRVVEEPEPAPAPSEPDDYPDDDEMGEYSDELGPPGGGPSTLKLTVDALTRPGAVVSGKVTFSDGKLGSWHLDSMGRLAVAPPEPGYQPSAEDVPEFSASLLWK